MPPAPLFVLPERDGAAQRRPQPPPGARLRRSPVSLGGKLRHGGARGAVWGAAAKFGGLWMLLASWFAGGLCFISEFGGGPWHVLQPFRHPGPIAQLRPRALGWFLGSLCPVPTASCILGASSHCSVPAPVPIPWRGEAALLRAGQLGSPPHRPAGLRASVSPSGKGWRSQKHPKVHAKMLQHPPLLSSDPWASKSGTPRASLWLETPPGASPWESPPPDYNLGGDWARDEFKDGIIAVQILIKPSPNPPATRLSRALISAEQQDFVNNSKSLRC